MNALAACLSSLHCFGLVLVLKASHSAVITGLQTPGDDICKAVMIKIKLHPVIYLSSIHKNHFTAKYQAFFVNFSALLTSAVTHTEHLQHCSLICPAGVAAELAFPQRDIKWGDGMKADRSPELYLTSHSPPLHTPCQQVGPYLSPTELSHWMHTWPCHYLVPGFVSTLLSTFCAFPDFPFPHYLKKDKNRVYLHPPPSPPSSHTLSHTHPLFYLSLSYVYERRLVFITKWGPDHDLPLGFEA